MDLNLHRVVLLHRFFGSLRLSFLVVLGDASRALDRLLFFMSYYFLLLPL